MERKVEFMANGHTICRDCRQMMNPGEGCSATIVQIGDTDFYRIQSGDRQDLIPCMGLDRTCHDCNVKPGQYHHYGCSMERCPRCGDQLYICRCNGKYYIKTKTDTKTNEFA